MDAPIVWVVLFFVVAAILLPLLTRGGVAAGAYQAIPHLLTKAEPPACPTCGDVIVLRKAKSGPSIGAEFWGCSRYPKCRGMKAQQQELLGA